MTAPPAGALLPCPFCGCEPSWHGGPLTYVQCRACGCDGPWNDDGDIDAAAAAWNLRTNGPALLAALRLREECEGLVARIHAEAGADKLGCLDEAGGYKSPSHRAGWNFAHGRETIADDLARILEEG